MQARNCSAGHASVRARAPRNPTRALLLAVCLGLLEVPAHAIDEQLRELLKAKGLISDAELETLEKADPQGDADQRLRELLRAKGLISSAELETLEKGKPAVAARPQPSTEQAQKAPQPSTPSQQALAAPEPSKPAEPARGAPEPSKASVQAQAVPEPGKPSEQAQKAPAGKTVSGFFTDGIVWETDDKRNSLRVSGRIEADYRHFLGQDGLNADTFDIRRAYLGVGGKFWDYYDYVVVGDLAGLSGPTAAACTTPTCSATFTVPGSSASHLDEAWLQLSWWKQARFRFGQFDTPFSLDTLTSDRFTDFVERSMGSTYLAQGKSRGVMVLGVPYKGVYYGLSYTNVAGKNTNDLNPLVDGKDVTGRLVGNFAEILGHPRSIYHFGGSFSSGQMPPGSTAPNARTDARGITFFVPSAFSGTAIDRQRRGLEAILAWHSVKLQGEYINGNFSGTSAAGAAYDRGITTRYLDLNWLITGEDYASAYSDGKIGRLRPKQDFAWGGGWGAWEVGLGFDRWDASDFPILAVGAANPGTGVLIPTLTSVPTNKASTWILGLKWMLNPNTRFLLQYTRTNFDTPVTVTSSGVTATTDYEDAITVRAQFDF